MRNRNVCPDKACLWRRLGGYIHGAFSNQNLPRALLVPDSEIFETDCCDDDAVVDTSEETDSG
jgi:hypothetical protein